MCTLNFFCFFFFNDTATPEIYTLSLHDALPNSRRSPISPRLPASGPRPALRIRSRCGRDTRDRKSTRLYSSHVRISYAVFCLKKKKKTYSHLFYENTNKQRKNNLNQ